MHKRPLGAATLLSLLLCLPLTAAVSQFSLVNEAGQPVKTVQASQFFKPASALAASRIETDPQKLAAVARETLGYLRKYPQDRAATVGLLKEFKLSVADVERTLQKIVSTVEADTKAKAPQRILNTAFLNKEFKLLHWQADAAGAKEHKVKLLDQRLRITKYVVFEAKGKSTKSGEYTCALYAIPPDEQNLTLEQADARKDNLLRFKFNKQQIVAGALDDKGVKPLVWLTRQGLEDALLQGSIMVSMPDGSKRMFNVHRNNGIAYDRTIKEPRNQRRYWYFKEVKGIQGYGQEEKITIQPAVTFAGDVYNLGLGKLVAMRYLLQGKPVMRLGILADTGGAFIPNLYQLDYLAGVYPDRASFQKGVAALPEYAETYLLTAR